MQIQAARQQAAQQDIANKLNILTTADKLLGGSEERQFQRQAALESMRESAAFARQTEALKEQRRHSMVTEALAREQALQRGEAAKATASYRRDLLNLRQAAVEAAGDKKRSVEARSAWKDFNSITNEISRAVRSKSKIVPFEAYDAWANHAMRLKQLGEDVDITIPITVKNKVFEDETIELTPERWLQLRRVAAKRDNVTPAEMIEVAKKLGWVRKVGGNTPVDTPIAVMP